LDGILQKIIFDGKLKYNNREIMFS